MYNEYVIGIPLKVSVFTHANQNDRAVFSKVSNFSVSLGNIFESVRPLEFGR